MSSKRTATKKKILIVEDEALLGDILQEKLRKEGYEVAWARNGHEGLEQARVFSPDLILLDIVMPSRDGYEVMDVVSADAVLKKIPVIVISNSGQPVELERLKERGVRDFLVKVNFTPQEVLEKVKRQFEEEAFVPNSRLADVDESDKTAVTSDETETDGGVAKNGTVILVVEDDRLLRDLIVRKLARTGFETREAIDGESALSLLQREHVDLILLDLILPGMDGYEVLRSVKEDTKLSDLPVVVLSNLGGTEDAEKSMRLGARDFVLKANFSPAEVVEKVKKILAGG